MSDAPPDFYRQKTNDELLFLVEHPHYYQPPLVEAARGELRRRGALPVATPAPVPAALLNLDAPAALVAPGAKTGLLTLLAAAALALGAGALYYGQYHGPAAVAAAAAAPKGPPQLTEVATSAIPNYDGAVARAVAAQLRRVPAAERTSGPHLRQFRELAKRFWAAETQSEYLVNQAHAGQAGPMFADQALVVRETWRAWNKAAVYRYAFGPVMKGQLERMGKAASSQQHILDNMPALLPGRAFLKDKEMQAREAEVQDWLAGVLPQSPVSGRAYRATVLRMHL